MGLESLSLIVVFAKDYQAMKDWYGKALGLVLDEQRTSDEGMWAQFDLPKGGTIAIHGGIPVAKTEGGVPPIVPVLHVSDIEATIEEMKERGVEFVKEARSLGEPTVVGADFVDAEGNLLQVVEVKR